MTVYHLLNVLLFLANYSPVKVKSSNIYYSTALILLRTKQAIANNKESILGQPDSLY